MNDTIETPASSEKKSEYNKVYYTRKRDDLLARKRDRYAADPDYRERLKADASRRRKKNRGKPSISFGGSTVQAFRVSDLAEAVGKSLSTINFWQKHGTIPETPFRSDGGYRLYTKSMIDAVSEVALSFPRPDRGDAEFRAAVESAWRSAGVPV